MRQHAEAGTPNELVWLIVATRGSRIVVVLEEPRSDRGWPIDREQGGAESPDAPNGGFPARFTSSPDTAFRTPPIGRCARFRHIHGRSMPNMLMKVSEKALLAIPRPGTGSARALTCPTTHPHANPTRANRTLHWN